MLDLAITGGTCVLPTGTQAADIGVKDGRIVLVGGPAAIHAVQHTLYPPRWLERWPDDERDRLVFIVRDLEPDEILRRFADGSPAAKVRQVSPK